MAVIPALRINGVSMLPAATEIFAGTGTAEGGISSVLTVSTTSAQTGANTTETDLWTYSLPANTLSADNYEIQITAHGTTAANTNVKNIRVYFGATVVAFDNTTTSGADWSATATVTRTGATTQIANAMVVFFRTWFSDFTTPAETLASAVTVKVTGQNGTASAGDVVLRYARVDFRRPGA